MTQVHGQNGLLRYLLVVIDAEVLFQQLVMVQSGRKERRSWEEARSGAWAGKKGWLMARKRQETSYGCSDSLTLNPMLGYIPT